MKWFTIIFVLIFLPLQFCIGQQTPPPLNNDYPFKDGIYLSFEEFKGDNPTYTRDQFMIDDIDSTDYDLTKVKKIKVIGKKGKWKRLKVGKIWGLTYDGVPYIYYRGMGSINSPISNYEKLTRIDVIGTICMFRLEHFNKAFNTNQFTHKSAGYGDVFVQDMLMDMNSGQIHLFDYHSVRHYIQHDKELLHELEEFRFEINLYDIVFAFNNRHLTFPSPVSFYSE